MPAGKKWFNKSVGVIMDAKYLRATYSLVFDEWIITTRQFRIKVHHLYVHGFPKNIKLFWHRFKFENCKFKLIANWIYIISWKKMSKTRRWGTISPDQPRNLAKTVTVR